ncbi:hypothetical protein E5676_scaffold145G00370 [Cucumis melo var. makuwa]|uniref:Uncharacterized protein n=1 Tax=Cucumis melo var. makuwa TaxID=1194695 RepID=A0A5D3BUW5_CUCMM|nr:hypothetical protein E5676_scaffold145G00370 [Cucumis melo var. makuwa]
MRNFFWEGHVGIKSNHLVKWNKRFSKEESALWRQIIRSIHSKEPFDWFTKGKSDNSQRSPWVSIAKVWRSVDSLASFNLGNGRRIGFWSDPWIGNAPIKEQYSRLFKIALLPTSSVAAIGTMIPLPGHWPLEEV